MKNFKKRIGVILLVMLLVLPFALPTKTSAGKLKPPSETFTPGQWFLGDQPPNLDPAKPPIVFVQGKNGSSTSWYGETTYHGINDMYTKAYDAGYQTVFVQLYDAAGKGSENQYTNGELLASMLSDISRHFNGKKVNIIAHSKGGPDTQAALIHYGAYRYVGRVITLGSPHRGSELADLSYSWYAGWLGKLLGQTDAGTYSLQVGEMAKFRTATDGHANRSKNKYYTVAGTNHGPALSALSLGGAYLSSYGANDGLVTETSSKLAYASHLFTDSTIDHDNIRTGSKVFSRIEPYLRSATVTQTGAAADSLQPKEAAIYSTSSNYIHGNALTQGQFVKRDIYIPEKTTGTISVYTADPSTIVELISPDGTTLSASRATVDQTIFSGASVFAFNLHEFVPGTWTVQMRATTANDAYLLAASFNDEKSYGLEMTGTGKAEQTTFNIHTPNQAGTTTSFAIKLIDKDGIELKQAIHPQSTNGTDFSAKLPKVPKPGVYNMTVDIKTKYPSGQEKIRTIVRSVYIE